VKRALCGLLLGFAFWGCVDPALAFHDRRRREDSGGEFANPFASASPRSFNADGAGSLDTIKCDTAVSTWLVGKTKATMGAWICLDGPLTRQQDLMINNVFQANGTTLDGQFLFGTVVGDAHVRVLFYSGAGVGRASQWNNTFTTGCHHYCWEGNLTTQECRLYKDGVDQGAPSGSGTWPATFRSSSAVFRLLNDETGTSNREMDGRICGVGMYDVDTMCSTMYNPTLKCALNLNGQPGAANLGPYLAGTSADDVVAPGGVESHGRLVMTCGGNGMESGDLSSSVP